MKKNLFTLFNQTMAKLHVLKQMSLIIFFTAFVSTAFSQSTTVVFGADFTGSPASYTFASTDVAYPTTSTFSTSGSNLCNGASRRTQVSSVILYLNSTAVNEIKVLGMSSGSSVRNLSAFDTSSTLTGTYAAVTGFTANSTINSSSACGELTISGLNLPAGKYIKFTFSGNVNLSGFTLTSSTPVTAPTTQASAINFTGVTSSGMNINWTNGNGSSRAVFVKETTQGTISNPVDGTVYTASSDWATKGTQLGTSGYYCVYSGTGSTVALSNLNASTTYWVYVFEYNGTGATSKFLTTSATGNPNSQATTTPPPATNYRSKTSGNWSDIATWESFDGTNWVNAAAVPTGTDGVVTIQSGHTVAINSAVTSATVNVNAGAEVLVAAGGTLTIPSGKIFTVSGALTDTIVGNPYTISGSMVFTSTGVYNLRTTPGSASGIAQIPTATWQSGSYCNIQIGNTGTTADYTGLTGIKQAFSNFSVNAPNLNNKILLTRQGGTTAPFMSIADTLKVINTGSGTGMQIISSGNNNNTLSVGTYYQTGGNVFIIHNASGAATRNFNVDGNFHVLGGLFDVANTTGTSTTNINNLNIKGNVTVSSGATLQRTNVANAAGTIANMNFIGTANQSVNIAGTFINNRWLNMVINNAAGVTLTSNIADSGQITFTSGVLSTGTNTLSLMPTASVSGASQTTGWIDGKLQQNIATGTAVTKTFDVGTNNYAPVAVNFASVTTAGDLIVSSVSGDHPNIASSGVAPTKSINRYWNLTNNGIVFTNADISFNWQTADADAGIGAANLKVSKYDNGTWSMPTVASPTLLSIQATGITSFSDFVVGELVTFPVQFKSISAAKKEAGIEISFITATEINTEHFVVEKSNNGKDFNAAATIKANGFASTYAWFDAMPFNADNYYRIKAVDKDEKITYSAVAKVAVQTVRNINVYPNPVKGNNINLSLNGLTKGTYQLRIFNNIGQVVYSSTLLHDGNNTIRTIDVKSLNAKGIYTLSLTGNELNYSQTLMNQ